MWQLLPWLLILNPANLMMLHQQRPIIAREGMLPIAAVLVLAAVLYYFYGWWVSFGVWIVAAALMFIFRDPRRQVPPFPLAIVAPIDGKIVSISQERDPYLDREAIRIKMRGSWWGVFGIRSVMEGKVNDQWFGALPNGVSQSLYSKNTIPPFAQWTQSDEGDDIVTTLSPKLARKGIRCEVNSGERIGQGKRCGFIPFGANAETFIPPNSRIDVKVGDKIKAGVGIIATLVR